MLVTFFGTGAMFPFHHSDGNAPARRACLKIISSSLSIASPHILSIRTLMLSWTCALLESRFWIILPISWKCDYRWVFFINIIDVTRKWTIIGNKGALFREKRVKEFSFLFKICYEAIIVKLWRHKRYFLIIQEHFY